MSGIILQHHLRLDAIAIGVARRYDLWLDPMETPAKHFETMLGLKTGRWIDEKTRQVTVPS